MGNYKHEFGKRFKAFRLNAGLTQKEAAKLLGYESHVTIYKIENGKQDVYIDKIPAICKAFGCDPLALLGIHEDLSIAHPEGSTIMEKIDSLPSTIMEKIDSLPAAQRNDLVKTVEILVEGMKKKEGGNNG